MSLVIGIKKNNVVSLFCDSQISSNDFKFYLSNFNNLKIFKLSSLKNCFIGCCGDVCISSIIKTLKFNCDEDFLIDYNFINNVFLPKLINKLKFYGKINLNSLPYTLDCSFLITQKNKLFVVLDDMSVLEISNNEFFCIGSGSISANPCLLNKKNIKYYDIYNVFKIVSQIDLFVGLPVYFVNTKTNIIKKFKYKNKI